MLIGKKVHKSGPKIVKPRNMPVHLAHNGSWIPQIWNDLSDSWWHRKAFPKINILLFQIKNCLLVTF